MNPKKCNKKIPENYQSNLRGFLLSKKELNDIVGGMISISNYFKNGQDKLNPNIIMAECVIKYGNEKPKIHINFESFLS